MFPLRVDNAFDMNVLDPFTSASLNKIPGQKIPSQLNDLAYVQVLALALAYYLTAPALKAAIEQICQRIIKTESTG
jgi:hypothetical protein